MASREDELEQFKTAINLSQYAAAQGYAIDRRASSRNSVTMRHGNGEKIVIGLGHDRHWVYFSVHDPGNAGSIVDFVMRHKGLNLGQCRKELRTWLGSAPLPHRPAAGLYAERLEPVTRDLIAVRARYEAATPLDGYSPYLCDERAIPAALLAQERFADRVRVDQRGNALFPHWNEEGICGYEVKNHQFTGFAPGGIKGLWGGRKTPQDDKLAIAETAIDALSYAALAGHGRTRFVSIAGQMNPDPQPALLQRAIAGMREGSTIVAAVDNDEGGTKIAAEIKRLFDRVNRPDLTFTIDVPSFVGADWNDVLKTGQPRPPSPWP